MSDLSDSSPGGMERQIDALRQNLAELRRQQSATRIQLIVVAIVVIGMFALFMSMTYSRIQKNFNEKDLQAAVAKAVPEISPQARNLLMGAVTNAMPTYRETAVARLHKSGPQIAKESIERFEKVPTEAGKEMTLKLQQSFDRVLVKIDPELKKRFPSLGDETRQAMLSDFLKKQIAAENEKLAKQMLQLHTNDLIRVHSALEKFKLPDGSTKPDVAKLERDLIHTLVLLMEDHLMEEDDEPAAVPVISPTTRPANPTAMR